MRPSDMTSLDELAEKHSHGTRVRVPGTGATVVIPGLVISGGHMSAVISLDQSLRLCLDQEEPQQCRFCQCTELSPCGIALAQDPDGTLRLARNDDEVWDVQACAWYIEGVCSSPSCIEQLIAERRGEATSRVLLFDGQGRAIPLGERSLSLAADLAADDRDFRLIGCELGLGADNISRESILDRIRELRRSAGERIA